MKLTIALLAVALASAAGAAGWKDLRIDASSEPAFRQSLETFKKELSPERQQVFTAALTDIWLKGTEEAKAAQRDFTADDYYRQIDGLGYEQIVTFTDPTGETAKQRYEDAKRNVSAQSPPPSPTPGTQAQRTLRSHGELESAELMHTRNASTSCHGGPCPSTTAPPAPQ